jgi:pimeloyl-ACP methyl ester carboxylesterase
VAGLVLIDPAPDGFYERAARERPDGWAPMLAEQNRQIASADQGVRDEWSAWDVTLKEALESDRGLKASVTLLTATNDEDGLKSTWIEEHRRWAARMPNVSHLVVEIRVMRYT